MLLTTERDICTEQRMREVRALWNQWDPINISRWNWQPAIEDEYDAYLANTLQLLEQGAPVTEIEAFLGLIAYDTMGLAEANLVNGTPREFAITLKTWFDHLQLRDTE